MTDTSRTLTLADLDSAKDLGLERVEVPEWGGAVYVRELPADQGIDMSDEMAAIPKEKSADALFVLLGHCLANADGSPLFGSVAEARQHLRPRSSRVLLRLQAVALKVNGMGDAAKNGSGEAAATASPTV